MTISASSPGEVIARRRREQADAVEVARRFVAAMPRPLGVRAAVVIGSTARGDFNKWSDIDVLVVADDLPPDPFGRLMALGDRPPGLQCIVWTPQDFVRATARHDPIVREATACGVWLVGDAETAASEPFH